MGNFLKNNKSQPDNFHFPNEHGSEI